MLENCLNNGKQLSFCYFGFCLWTQESFVVTECKKTWVRTFCVLQSLYGLSQFVTTHFPHVKHFFYCKVWGIKHSHSLDANGYQSLPLRKMITAKFQSLFFFLFPHCSAKYFNVDHMCAEEQFAELWCLNHLVIKTPKSFLKNWYAQLIHPESTFGKLI